MTSTWYTMYLGNELTGHTSGGGASPSNGSHREISTDNLLGQKASSHLTLHIQLFFHSFIQDAFIECLPPCQVLWALSKGKYDWVTSPPHLLDKWFKAFHTHSVFLNHSFLLPSNRESGTGTQVPSLLHPIFLPDSIPNGRGI